MAGFIGTIKNNYLATGSGILPFHDVHKAIGFVFDYYEYQLPFWFSLPNRSFFEKDVVQFCDKLPGFRIDEGQKKAWVDTKASGFDAAMEECVTRCMALDVDYFSFSQESSPSLYLLSQRLMGMNWQGWIKLQIVGPLSAAMDLCDESGRPLFFHEELGELIALMLSLKTAYLIKQLKVNAKTKLVVVIDESFINLNGIGLSTQDVISRFGRLVDIIHDNGALCALRISDVRDYVFAEHLCVDILHFDLGGNLAFLAEFENALASFLKKGGIPLIGCVPVDQGSLGDCDLRNRLFQNLKSHQLLLKNGALITTDGDMSSCSQDSVCQSAEICLSLAENLKLMF